MGEEERLYDAISSIGVAEGRSMASRDAFDDDEWEENDDDWVDEWEEEEW